MSENYLQVTAKIVKPTVEDLEQTLDDNGTVHGTDADVEPVNLWRHSLFSQVDVSLNDRLVTPSMNTYPYRAYLETLLSYGPAAKESYLSAALWYKCKFAFDLTADLDDGGHFQLVKQGNLQLELQFKTPLPETINVIVYAEFDNVIEVDKARNVIFDYSA